MRSQGNTAQRASGDFARNLHTSDTKQTLIFHKNAREYIKYSRAFLFHLTKNLTTHLSHNLCAVLPLIQWFSRFGSIKANWLCWFKSTTAS